MPIVKATNSKAFITDIDELPRSLKGIGDNLGEFAKRKAQELLSGKSSMYSGYPFRRNTLQTLASQVPPTIGPRGGIKFKPPLRGLVPILPINTRGGYTTRNSVRVAHYKDGSFIVRVTSHAAPFVLAPGGTRRMIDRQFWKTLHESVGAKAVKSHKDFLIRWDSRRPYRIPVSY